MYYNITKLLNSNTILSTHDTQQFINWIYATIKSSSRIILLYVASVDQQRNMSAIISDANVPKSSDADALPRDVQAQLLTTWNPVLPATSQGASFSNCTFNFYAGNTSPLRQQQRKRRFQFIYSDDDDDE